MRSLQPDPGVGTQGLDPHAFGPRALGHALHQAAGGARAAQDRRRLDVGDRQKAGPAAVGGEHHLPVDLQLEPAAARIVANIGLFHAGLRTGLRTPRPA